MSEIAYVVMNLLMAALAFGRAALALRYLDFRSLGDIAYIQTLVLLVSFVQMGLLNGGYRIFSARRAITNKRVNNFLFSFIFLLSLLMPFLGLIGALAGMRSSRMVLLFIGLISGVICIAANWASNALVAGAAFHELNLCNIISTVLSLSPLCAISIWRGYAIIFSILIQPLIFLVLVLLRNPVLRPSAFVFSFRLISFVLIYGFIPYLAGVLGYLCTQIERWSVILWLGTESLGKLYLALSYSNVFILIPNSLNNIYFPKGIRLFAEKNYDDFRKLLREFSLLLIAYAFMAFLLTFAFLPWFITHLFPRQVSCIKYIFGFLPALFATCMIMPLGLVFNASVRLKPLLVSYAAAAISSCLLLIALKAADVFDLMSIPIVDSAANVIVVLILWQAYLKTKQSLYVSSLVRFDPDTRAV
jgi:O-antigen/teichoic acid export membrane protein